MDYSSFCYLKNAEKLGTVHIVLANFRKETDDKYGKFMAHVIKVCTEAWLISQKKGKDIFDVTVDAENIKLKNMDRKLAKNLTITLQQLFPDKLNKCLIYNTPSIFYHFYDLIKVFIDKKTRDKIEITKKVKRKSTTVPSANSDHMNQVQEQCVE